MSPSLCSPLAERFQAPGWAVGTGSTGTDPAMGPHHLHIHAVPLHALLSCHTRKEYFCASELFSSIKHICVEITFLWENINILVTFSVVFFSPQLRKSKWKVSLYINILERNAFCSEMSV